MAALAGCALGQYAARAACRRDLGDVDGFNTAGTDFRPGRSSAFGGAELQIEPLRLAMIRRLVRTAAAHADNRLFSSRDILWQYAANFGAPVLGAAFVLLLGRFLGIEIFGAYALVAAVPAVVNALLDFRLQEVSIVLLNQNGSNNDRSRDIKISFLFDVATRSFALIASTFISYFVFRLYGLTIGLAVGFSSALAVFLAKAGNAVAMGILRQAGDIRIYAVWQTVDWAFRVGLLVACTIFFKIDIGLAFYIQLGPAMLCNMIIIRLSARSCTQALGLDLTCAALPQLGAFCREHRSLLLSSQAISSSEVVAKELDTLVCGAFLPPQGVAIYKMAKNISYMVWKLVDPLFVVILPGISRHISEGRMEELTTFIRASMGKLIVIAALLYLSGCAGAFIITYIALGPTYGDVPLVFPLISLWIVAALPLIWTHSVAIASNRAALQAVAGAIGNFSGLAVLSVGAALLGVYGAAIGLSIAFAAPFVLSFYLLTKKKIVRW